MKRRGWTLVTRLGRGWWRQLTSMRTALVLLFLLAVAAVPGSVLPQRNLGVEKVDAYRVENPELSRWLDRFGFFDVYSSPWFGAIYLLLFTSLVGCVLPRLREHVAAMRRRPPSAPRNFARLPVHAEVGVSVSAAPEAAERLRSLLRSRRYRVAVRAGDGGEVTVAAEKGYLRETGNLLFHFALLAVLGGVAIGYGWGWYGNRILVAGPDTGFCTNLQQFDEYGLGPRLQPGDLPAYCVELDRFQAEFLDNGQPTVFRADVSWSTPQREWGRHRLEVNTPLRLDGANLYLLGHGYAPVLRYTDRQGRFQTSVSPFLPIDEMTTSEGAAIFPDANADTRSGKRSTDGQVAFSGVYVPTVPTSGPPSLSAHPAERAPGLLLTAYRGNLGLETGVPQSVYEVPRRALDSGRLKQLPGQAKMLRPGERWTLDDGTALEFLGTRRWITVTVRHDPGEPVVLAGVIVMMVGLVATLSVRRRRVWFRLTPTGGHCTITAGGLPRSDYPGFAAEFTAVVAAAGAAPTVGPPSRPDGIDDETAADPVSASADNVRT
ncbi:cytochrome c biogenesis protein ResB [Micromonospora sp. WMMC250]|nr:cytochrome c biogenesis protein ResB [Micromonospora sp. WMMC250]MCZ7379869.1 cytochrome c biogenesis protein ResB [Micromonospora sp. WMMC250]